MQENVFHCLSHVSFLILSFIKPFLGMERIQSSHYIDPDPLPQQGSATSGSLDRSSSESKWLFGLMLEPFEQIHRSLCPLS